MPAPTRGLQYRGFTARVYYDEEEGEIIGHVPTTHGGLDFRASSFGSVEREFKAVIDRYLADHPDTKPVPRKR